MQSEEGMGWDECTRHEDKKSSCSTHMPELRTWYKTLRALFHLSKLLDTRHSLRVFSMRSMRSCFLPDLLSIVQHSSLNPAMICLSLSTVLCLTLTLRVCRIIVRRHQVANLWRNTSKSPQGSTADMVRGRKGGSED